jgi:hypothetical protein
MIRKLHEQAYQQLETSVLAFQNSNPQLAEQVIGSKVDFQSASQAVMDRLRVELIINRAVEPILFQLELDVVGQYDRIHYVARKIAKLVSPKTPVQAEDLLGHPETEESPNR